MKKIVSVVSSVALAAAMIMPLSAIAANGTDHVGPLAGASQDGSSCGGVWANDTYNLVISVHDNGDGTFAVRTDYKDGAFVTLGGGSPGACETANHHGSTVTAGIKGKFQGFVAETVTAAAYNANGCSNASLCTTRTDALNMLFPGNSQSDFSWNFEYNSSDKTLQYRHWQDKSDSTGNSDVFEGDIATN